MSKDRFKAILFSGHFGSEKTRFKSFSFLDVDYDKDPTIEKIKEADLLIFPCNYELTDIDLVECIKQEIKTRRLAVIFLRGIVNSSAPKALGFTKDFYVDWGYCKYFNLYMTNFERVFKNSKIFEQFIKTYHLELNNFKGNEKYFMDQSTIGQHEYLKNLKDKKLFDKLNVELLEKNAEKHLDKLYTLNLEGSYTSSIHFGKVINLEKDWEILAFSKDNDHVGIPILLHKHAKVLFCHWYAFSTNDTTFSQDLMKCCLEYLLKEHLTVLENKLGNLLFKKIENGQLIDLDFNCLNEL
ncbi:hypothetical protein ABK040_011716 [Willaertia magna]